MSKTPRVFVSHDTGNVSLFAAKRFGDIVTCVEGHVINEDYDIAHKEIIKKISTASSGDYLLLLGSPALMALAAAEMSKRVEYMRILSWDKRRQGYDVIDVAHHKSAPLKAKKAAKDE